MLASVIIFFLTFKDEENYNSLWDGLEYTREDECKKSV